MVHGLAITGAGARPRQRYSVTRKSPAGGPVQRVPDVRARDRRADPEERHRAVPGSPGFSAARPPTGCSESGNCMSTGSFTDPVYRGQVTIAQAAHGPGDGLGLIGPFQADPGGHLTMTGKITVQFRCIDGQAIQRKGNVGRADDVDPVHGDAGSIGCIPMMTNPGLDAIRLPQILIGWRLFRRLNQRLPGDKIAKGKRQAGQQNQCGTGENEQQGPD